MGQAGVHSGRERRLEFQHAVIGGISNPQISCPVEGNTRGEVESAGCGGGAAGNKVGLSEYQAGAHAIDKWRLVSASMVLGQPTFVTALAATSSNLSTPLLCRLRQ